MAGLYDPLAGQGSAAIAAEGTWAIPSSTGEVLGAAAGGVFAHAFPTADIWRIVGEEAADTAAYIGLDGDQGQGPILEPEEARRRYGIEGRLDFPGPVYEEVARERNRRYRERIMREDTIARREQGLLTGGAARFAAGLAGGLPGIVDPLNIASAFIPFVGPTRAAIWAARAGPGALAQAGVRAKIGAVQGAAGQALLTPLYWGISRHDGEDYAATDALLDIALGGIFGGGLHTALGRAPGPRATALALDLEDAAPELREGLLRGAVADLAEGRPVESPAEIWDRSAYIAEAPAGVRPYERVPREPLRLAEYLRQQGGLRDEGGELADMLGSARARPGLRNRAGLPLDEAALKAWQEGFLPGAERPDINTLLEALDRDLRDRPVYREQDEFAAAQHRDAVERNAEIDRLAAEHEIPLGGKTQQQFYDAVAEKLGRDAALAETERLAPIADDIMKQAEAEGWLPDFGEGAPTTAAEIEHAYRQEAAQRIAAARAYGIEGPEPVGGAAGALEAGARRQRDGAGAGRRGQPDDDIAAIDPERLRELSAEESRAEQDLVQEQLAELDRRIAEARDAGALADDAPELRAGDAAAAEAEDWARAIEQGGLCLGRRL